MNLKTLGGEKAFEGDFPLIYVGKRCFLCRTTAKKRESSREKLKQKAPLASKSHNEAAASVFLKSSITSCRRSVEEKGRSICDGLNGE